jgi:hypothetical protein
MPRHKHPYHILLKKVIEYNVTHVVRKVKPIVT